ncbi:amidohydrolase family protein [Ancylobacter sp. MQZ15Z-1]|uniref:Amidohydrolase family protein n=1 Tax=Ancylobacter mangrovi TaxID=2972472 RepID=A0A9X2T4K5_9HYPH|nr:amidohydrolase family protein [Ancylobacter mangrovi]MCS0494469.1 amidohydrolase family protein [Ancylobacter mangrovi]
MEPCQGPRETTRPPSFAVPPLACDCHSHILGPVERYPYVENRSFTPPDASPQAYLAMLGALGIERMVVVQPSVYGADNRRTADAVGELGVGRARGVAMVGQNVDAAELRALDDAGIRATRFITTAGGGPSLDNLPGVARKVAEVGWHIEMYVPLDTWPKVLPVIETLPVSVVFDHMGGLKADVPDDDPILGQILRLLDTGRHWVKLCGYRNSQTGYPYGDVTPLARRFVERVPERCVWGTDWPHTAIKGRMPDDGELLDLLGEWVPDVDTRKRILVDNPARLYRFA